MAEHDCARCVYPILDTAYACHECGKYVAKRLREQAENYAEMHLQIARQSRYGDKVRLSGSEPPLPFSVEASIDHGSVVNTITTWARHISEQRGEQPPSVGRNLMLWLADQTDWLRYRQEAGEALDELDYATRIVERCIDAPAQHWYAGRCQNDDCGADLYGRTGAKVVRCRQCGADYDAEQTKTWLLRQADDVLGTASEVARFVSSMRGDLVTSAQIRGMAFRGRIAAHGKDRLERPTYRVGDVIGALS